MLDVKDYERFTNFFSVPRTREELKKEWKCDDRTVRDTIAKLQMQLNIINMQDGKGYYIPQTTKEVVNYSRQEYSRGIKAVAKAYRMLKRTSIENQIEIDEIMEDIHEVLMYEKI